MIRTLRTTHRWLWTILLLALPLAYLAALDRRPSLAPPRILAILDWNFETVDKMEIIEKLDPGWRGVPITLAVRSDEKGRVWLTAVPNKPKWSRAPDPVVLFRPADETAEDPNRPRAKKPTFDPATVLETSILLGPLAEQAWPLPPEAARGGTLFLYSVPEHAVLAQTRMPIMSRQLVSFGSGGRP